MYGRKENKMALKEAKLINVKNCKHKLKKEKALPRLVKGGITALVGLALFSEVAGAIRRI